MSVRRDALVRYKSYLRKFNKYLQKLEQYERRNGRVENAPRYPLTLEQLLYPAEISRTSFEDPLSSPLLSQSQSTPPRKNWLSELKDVVFESPSPSTKMSFPSEASVMSRTRDESKGKEEMEQSTDKSVEDARDLALYNRIYSPDHMRRAYEFMKE